MRKTHLLLFAAVLAVLATACRKDLEFTSDAVSLDFSRDTVLFDTVFTTVGTTTKAFTVRNPSKNAVKVDIALEGGSPSPFRINVDGASGLSFEDVEILGEDSIYIFVEATLGVGGVNTPFIIEDHILFNTNGSQQSVLLTAWGQDAHFFRPDRSIPGLPAFSIIAGEDDNGNSICETVTWPNDKPYVIYGYAVVDSCSTLLIDPGVRVYVHGGGGLWVYRYGRIRALGTVDDRITFQGDRLEPEYQDVPGQWERIWINDGANGEDNEFRHVDIRNALVGIQCENFPGYPDAPTSEAKLILDKVSIRDCSAAGILSRNYRITCTNSLIADCGQYNVALTGGGQYDFNFTTIANYWSVSGAVRNTPAFIMTNTYEDLVNQVLQVREIFTSSFRNTIIEGYNTKEFQVALEPGNNADYTFRNCILRTDEATNDATHFPDQSTIWRNQSPGFANGAEGDFHLGSVNAFAVDKAQPGTGVFDDLDGAARDAAPDLGCYEFVP
ncbi:MAG: hypothetical protein JNL05_04980 [Flavobacteriales bacterium]|nr:hypothetical protein [Flavobacteriales bacterium]